MPKSKTKKILSAQEAEALRIKRKAVQAEYRNTPGVRERHKLAMLKYRQTPRTPEQLAAKRAYGARKERERVRLFGTVRLVCLANAKVLPEPREYARWVTLVTRCFGAEVAHAMTPANAAAIVLKARRESQRVAHAGWRERHREDWNARARKNHRKKMERFRASPEGVAKAAEKARRAELRKTHAGVRQLYDEKYGVGAFNARVTLGRAKRLAAAQTEI